MVYQETLEFSCLFGNCDFHLLNFTKFVSTATEKFQVIQCANRYSLRGSIRQGVEHLVEYLEDPKLQKE